MSQAAVIKCQIIATHPVVEPIAQNLAKQWNMEFGGCCETLQSKHKKLTLIVRYIEELHPELAYQIELSKGDGTKPVCINFNTGKASYRILHGGGKNQAIARAVGIKSDFKPSIIDATAGMAQDAFVLAHLGCKVQLLERSPIIALLLQDGIRRAKLDSKIGHWVKERIQLEIKNSIEFLRSHATLARHHIDVVYLDPMYPHRNNSALVKKEMRILRELVGDDIDSGILLDAALNVARKRVVVKRPKGAAELINPKNRAPSHTIETKSTRYDVYMITQ